jgi:DNA-binding transcriptional ArsR family regulator
MIREASAGKPYRHAPRSWPKLPRAAELDRASAMFRALGDPARLRLLARLAGSEISVTELADLENEKLTTISARLQTLREARLVKRRREAKRVYYALMDTHVLQLVQSAMEHAAEKQ